MVFIVRLLPNLLKEVDQHLEVIITKVLIQVHLFIRTVVLTSHHQMETTVQVVVQIIIITVIVSIHRVAMTIMVTLIRRDKIMVWTVILVYLQAITLLKDRLCLEIIMGNSLNLTLLLLSHQLLELKVELSLESTINAVNLKVSITIIIYNKCYYRYKLSKYCI